MQRQKERYTVGACSQGYVFIFCFYTATAVHEVDATRLRMRMVQFLGVFYSALCFRYCTGVIS